eukprot:TRINITY_DN74841_c0_g1_i1.p2 TRINITY_DN74841_c0_g1~~TRINITY_DN74841_c0_g1_i1.p2  ORF type:complete len:132 (-),score=12.62 TRINITY_DN74841_c0_g1_i1:43-438(-)
MSAAPGWNAIKALHLVASLTTTVELPTHMTQPMEAIDVINLVSPAAFSSTEQFLLVRLALTIYASSSQAVHWQVVTVVFPCFKDDLRFSMQHGGHSLVSAQQLLAPGSLPSVHNASTCDFGRDNKAAKVTR